MKCPICNHHVLKVLAMTVPGDDYHKYRYRECQDCFTRFSTIESVIYKSIDEHIRNKVEGIGWTK